MQTSSMVESVLEELQLLETVTQAYGEIASIRMKGSREGVLTARDYLLELQDVFDDVRASYEREVNGFLQKRFKNRDAVTFLSHNGKDVAVLLSANTGLYGEIVTKTFHMFLETVRASDCEVTIVGKQGLAYFKTVEPERAYTYFDLPDYRVGSNDLAEIIKHIVQYKEIKMFYGKFNNVLSQEPDVYTISSQVNLQQTQDREVREYVFEPTLKDILKFFETEMFASLIEQTVRESQLAKFASRIIAMDQASDKIQQEKDTLKQEKLVMIHREHNRRQLNALPAILMNVR